MKKLLLKLGQSKKLKVKNKAKYLNKAEKILKNINDNSVMLLTFYFIKFYSYSIKLRQMLQKDHLQSDKRMFLKVQKRLIVVLRFITDTIVPLSHIQVMIDIRKTILFIITKAL